MDLDIDIIRKADCPVGDGFLRSVVERTVALSGGPSSVSRTRVALSVILTDDAEVRAMNQQHRDRDATTDILSFPNFEGGAFEADPDGAVQLGDLVLSVPFVVRSAEEDHVPFDREFAYILSHGVLHLLGYDHSEAMFSLQDAVTDGAASEDGVE